MLKKLTPNLMTEDVNRTLDFYTEVLGFERLATVPETGQLDWAMLRRDGVELMLQSRASLGGEISALASTSIGASQSLYIEVSGLDELYQQLKEQVEIVAERHTTFYGTEEFAFKDCNGYVLVFSESRQEQ
jgi:uncharacterized glyoxalase superfamily protein PhnB